jgi:hypothetical protein
MYFTRNWRLLPWSYVWKKYFIYLQSYGRRKVSKKDVYEIIWQAVENFDGLKIVRIIKIQLLRYDVGNIFCLSWIHAKFISLYLTAICCMINWTGCWTGDSRFKTTEKLNLRNNYYCHLYCSQCWFRASYEPVTYVQWSVILQSFSAEETWFYSS